MKKILFINTLYRPDIGGGAEIVLQAQVEGLKSKGYDVVILTTKEKGDITFDFINNIKVYRAGIKNLYWPHKKESHNSISKFLWHLKDRHNDEMMKYLHHVIHLEKPDLVICHNLTGWTIATWKEVKKFNIPVFQVLHDQYLLCLNSNMYKNGRICEKQCLLCGFMRKDFASRTINVDVVIGVSRYILDKFVNNGYFLSSRQEVVHNRLKINDKNSSTTTIASYTPLRIGFIGTLSVVKGIDILIKAFKKTNINATLVIAGKGEANYEDYLKRLASGDNRIQFIGYVESNSFYSSIDLLVVPSLWNDTFPGVAIEACANNLAVIASKRGGLPEIIKDEVNGILIEPTEESIHDSILFYYENPSILELHKQNSKKSAENLLDFDKMIQEYIDLIESL
jgi:glycosyltransferase involved in cell wall biosynthesis